jgi:hypothetical protein
MAGMSKETKFGYGFWFAGIGVPYLLDQMFGRVPAFWCAVAFTVIGAGLLIAGHQHREADEVPLTKPKKAIGYAVMALLLAGLTVGIVKFRPQTAKIEQREEAKPHEDERPIPKKVEPQPQVPRATKATREPEVEMYFVTPQNVEWRVRNNSSRAVQNVLYWFFLVDIDQPFLGGNPPIPLRIPVQKIDFINANDFSGALVLPSDLQRAVRIGDRIFGTAQVACPGCKDKAYWLYFKVGDNGWFSKMHGHTSRGLLFPMGAIVADPDKEIETLVPSASRVAITGEH